jgi:hypothetical protein
MKLRLFLAAAAFPALTFLAPITSSSPAGETSIVPGIGNVVQEPVLVWDVTGSGIAGPLHSNVVVYNNGLVSYSSFFLFTGNDGQACTTNVSPSTVKRLASDLAKAGAGTLGDNSSMGADIPLTTITFFQKPGTDSSAHTFSFFHGTAYMDVQTILWDFQSKHVPSCSGNDF